MTDSSQFGQQSFKERLFNDIELIKEITNIFLEDTTVHINEMKAFADAGNIEEAKKVAHKIKGAAANMSAEKLHFIAQDIELGTQQADPNTLNESILALEKNYKLLETDLATFLNKL